MNLDDKISQAHRTIEVTLAAFRNPAVMCSFGKDSLVLLHLVRQQRDLPVIFHREPFQHHKYEFANRVMRDWDLTVFDYLPLTTAVKENEQGFEVQKFYQIGQRRAVIPIRLAAPLPGERIICGLTDIYDGPKGNIVYPFDMVFSGHKSADVDFIHGPIPLAADVSRNMDCASTVFALRDFTDEDVWAYTELHDLPVHRERYEKIDGRWQEQADKYHNPDYVSGCMACMSAKSPAIVACPKLNGLEITNVSAQLRQADNPVFGYLK